MALFEFDVRFFLIAALLILAARVAWTWWRLSHIPGPKIAAVTDLYRVFAQSKQSTGLWLQDLHRQYGPVVRIGPNAVSFADATVTPIIFGTSPVWRKAKSYHILDGMTSSGKFNRTLASKQDEQWHSQMKKPVISAFTPNSVLEYENHVDETMEKFFRELVSVEKLNLAEWLQWYSMDVLNRIAFSADPGFVEHRADIENTLTMNEYRFWSWVTWGPIYRLNRILLLISFYLSWRKSSPSPISRLAMERIRERSADKNAHHHDLLQRFVDVRQEHEGKFTDEMVLGLTVSVIGAGADTTAVALVILLHTIYNTPTVLQKLRAEIDEARLSGLLSDPPQMKEAAKLPYLDLIIRESGRATPVVSVMLERVVPPGGSDLAGYHLPAETVVGCSPMVTLHDEKVYGPNPGEFNPDRWLVSEEERRFMERNSLEFGGGKRVCIGRHIARLNVLKFVTKFVMDYDIIFADPNAPLKTKPNAVAYKEPLIVKVERRKQAAARAA